MGKAVFFILSAESDEKNSEQHNAIASIVCSLYEKKRRCSVFCQDQNQAEMIDEVLWQLPTDRFVPHKIGHEGDHKPAPIELNWQLQRRWSGSPIINLAPQFQRDLLAFPIVYDFVPVQETDKQLARERYKHYREGGFVLETHPIDKLQEILNGQDL